MNDNPYESPQTKPDEDSYSGLPLILWRSLLAAVAIAVIAFWVTFIAAMRT
jgi:hypothetical protein